MAAVHPLYPSLSTRKPQHHLALPTRQNHYYYPDCFFPVFCLHVALARLYEQHVEAVSGKPISFHHISKTGGTTLCGVAWENGCRGPGMSKKDNCLLDTG